MIRNLDVADGQYKIAVTALLDRKDHSVGLVGVAVDRGPLAATKRLAMRSLVAGGLARAGVRARARAVLVAPARRADRRAPPRRDRGVARRSRSPDRDPGRRRADRSRDRVQPDDVDAAGQPGAARRAHARDRRAARRRPRGVVGDRLESVSRKIVDAVARTFDVQLAALWLVDGGARHAAALRASAARARRAGRVERARDRRGARRRRGAARRSPSRSARRAPAAAARPRGRRSAAFGEARAQRRRARARWSRCRSIARRASSACSRSRRAASAREFSEADLNLLTTFADQAGAAVENALLYSRGPRGQRGAREEGPAPHHRADRDQHRARQRARRSARDPGPARAVRADGRPRPAGRRRRARDQLADRRDPRLDRRPDRRARAGVAPRRRARRAGSAPRVGRRRRSSALAPVLAERAAADRRSPRARRRASSRAALDGGRPARRSPSRRRWPPSSPISAPTPTRRVRLIDALGADRALAPRGGRRAHRPRLPAPHRVDRAPRGRVRSSGSSARSRATRTSISRRSRTEADLHEGLETTLALLHHALRDIVVERRFGSLPRVPVYVDELNQVWTNLIQNAQQALTSRRPRRHDRDRDRGRRRRGSWSA